MKTLYLILAIIGFIAPNVFVVIETVNTSNFLLWLDPKSTITGMFANTISSAFIVDLLVVVLVFFVWTYFDSRKYRIKNIWIIWILTMLFGISSTFPLYLYLRERNKQG